MSSHHDSPGADRPSSPAPAVPKQFMAGTHRTISPEETVARVRPFLPILGITRIADVTGLDTLGVPVVMVIRPNSRSISVSPGKGLTLDAARASGVMESIEHWHAERILHPLKLGSVNEMRFGHCLLDVGGLPRLSLQRFHDNLCLHWVLGENLVGNAPTWVPFEIVHTNYSLPLVAASGAFVMSSNGLASGNHPLEALSHAICELVERDAATLWHLSGKEMKRRTRLDLSTVDDPGCMEVLGRIERAGVLAVVWDLTSDIGIPTYCCTLVDREPNPARPLAPMIGFGCHPARGIALLRAITEAAQCRLTVITGARDDVRARGNGPEEDLCAALRFVGEHGAEPAERAFSDAPDHAGETLDDDVAWEVDRLRAAGLHEIVAVDLTRPELRIPVVRVVIPGLEPLYDIPGYIPGARAQRRLAERTS
ncbi:YcaO-like family protein [Polyangium mundeleinium]|uniref:YcaO-like family protein n=1 Tax=Polyangium mundeleinium TaxID=2995306 RepID=A0ABT5ESR6_9BACT|nr:YcaO-like family protein [Polyangium mundeleinium]MDC0744856.1 YcaO-like family protein [Polyangium mundeleinium]